MKCKDCGDFYYYEESKSRYFCVKCEYKYQQRNEFRKVMDEINKINNMPTQERNFLSGFSWAEKERFSLIMKKFLKANHFPVEDDEFVHDHAKKELQEIKERIFF